MLPTRLLFVSIAAADAISGQVMADGVSVPVPTLNAQLQIFLPRLVIGDREGHQLLQRDLFLPIQRRGNRVDAG